MRTFRRSFAMLATLCALACRQPAATSAAEPRATSTAEPRATSAAHSPTDSAGASAPPPTSVPSARKPSGAAGGKAPRPSKDTPAKPRPCASTAACGAGEHCSTDDGVCSPPPDCKPGQMCAEVCYGTCVPAPAPLTSCRTDADCEARASYCEGCRCDAALKGSPRPPCKGPTAACLVDPCSRQRATCKQGSCLLAPNP